MEINFLKLILKINLRFFNDGNNFQLNANKIFECDGHFNFLMHTSCWYVLTSEAPTIYYLLTAGFPAS